MAEPLQDNPLVNPSAPSIEVSKTDTDAGADPITPPPSDDPSDDPNDVWKQEVIKRIFNLQDMADKRFDALNVAGTNFLKSGTYVPPTFDPPKEDTPKPEATK